MLKDVMQLAGVPVARRLVLDLTDRLTLVGADDTATLLLIAHAREQRIVGLSITDREMIIAVLYGPPAGLETLRAVLLQEHSWRLAEGL
jgi:hypothetical protein